MQMTGRSNIVTASRQWQFRPADQRFWTLAELLAKTRMYAEQSQVKTVELSKCTVLPDQNNGQDLHLVGPEGGQAEFQHYAFGQMANLCTAPAAYLRTLPASIAAECLNHGLAKIEGEQTLLFHQNGGLHLRCVTSTQYKRIWNYEIAELALALEEGEGWRVPPARPCGLENVPVRIATDDDVLRKSAHPSLGIKVGDEISPSGLYASDHDLFIFQVNEDRPIDGGDGELMYRGVFWSNSEVGDARFRATMFLYDTVCGNHIVWGAKKIAEVSIRHTGKAQEQFSEAMAQITKRVREDEHKDELRIRQAKIHQLGQSKESIIDFVFKRNFGLSKTECENAYVLACRYEDQHGGDPHSAWGYAAGVTRLSQQKYADERDRMDRAAGRILETAF